MNFLLNFFLAGLNYQTGRFSISQIAPEEHVGSLLFFVNVERGMNREGQRGKGWRKWIESEEMVDERKNKSDALRNV